MEIYNISHAKTQLSALIARVEKGEEIVIGRADKPLAKLVPYVAEEKAGFLGIARGRMAIPALDDLNKWDEDVAQALTMEMFTEAA